MKTATKKAQTVETVTVVKNLERGQKTKMIQKLLAKKKTVGEVLKTMNGKGIKTYDSEVRRLIEA